MKKFKTTILAAVLVLSMTAANFAADECPNQGKCKADVQCKEKCATCEKSKEKCATCEKCKEQCKSPESCKAKQASGECKQDPAKCPMRGKK